MKILTLNRMETHDRLLEYLKNSDQISQGCETCIKNRPKEFLDLPFYIFAHFRTHDDGVTKRLIWSPRLTKPEPQVNSLLFRCYPPDNVKVVWILPSQELWENFRPGKMTHVPDIWTYIQTYLTNRKALAEPDPDALSDEKIANIYQEIANNLALKTKKN